MRIRSGLRIRLLRSLLIALAILPCVRGEDDLVPLSDEFNHGPTIANWQRIYQVEGWGNDVLAQLDIDTTRPGRLFMRPYSSSWYAEWRGELMFKEVSGDFVVTTEVEPTRQSGAGAPQSSYSLAGIMVRTPRAMTSPAQWTAGGQNYIFLSLGAASQPGSYQYEVKTTRNSESVLNITDGAPPRAGIQVARLGPHLITLRRAQGGAWQVHRRYARPDMPSRLQAGLTVYTDWPLCERVGFANQNTRVLTNGAPLAAGGVVAGANPDLLAAFDYVRFRRPQVPPQLAGANFSDPAAVSDAQLLGFLGAQADAPYLPPPSLRPSPAASPDRPGGFSLRVQAHPGLAGTLLGSPDLSNWSPILDFPGTGAEIEIADPGSASEGLRFYRAVARP